ncbi:MAG: MFS transporter, partial [Proteobacteria bacterium]|nr:MFS transporter [Pseudomonadota bacterium]
VAVVGFVFFLAWELTEQHPVVDLSLFRRRNFWSGALATAVGYGLFFGNVVLLPLWLQQFMGYTATQAGMVLAPVGLLAIVLSPVVGVTMHRVDPRLYVTASFLVFGLVFWLRSLFTVETDFVTIMIPTLIQGIGMAGFFIPLVTITLSGLPPSRIAAAAGLSNFTRITAGAFGVSIATTAWEDRATLHHAQLAEHVNAARPVVEQTLGQLQAGGMNHEQALGFIDRLVTQQAYMISTQEIFYLSALLFVGLIPLVWLTRRVRGAAADAGGAH